MVILLSSLLLLMYGVQSYFLDQNCVVEDHVDHKQYKIDQVRTIKPVSVNQGRVSNDQTNLRHGLLDIYTQPAIL
jgi:hypothetical protein